MTHEVPEVAVDEGRNHPNHGQTQPVAAVIYPVLKNFKQNEKFSLAKIVPFRIKFPVTLSIYRGALNSNSTIYTLQEQLTECLPMAITSPFLYPLSIKSLAIFVAFSRTSLKHTHSKTELITAFLYIFYNILRYRSNYYNSR